MNLERRRSDLVLNTRFPVGHTMETVIFKWLQPPKEPVECPSDAHDAQFKIQASTERAAARTTPPGPTLPADHLLLTITTQASGSKSSLPRVSYIKAVDVSGCPSASASSLLRCWNSPLSTRDSQQQQSPSKAAAACGIARSSISISGDDFEEDVSEGRCCFNCSAVGPRPPTTLALTGRRRNSSWWLMRHGRASMGAVEGREGRRSASAAVPEAAAGNHGARHGSRIDKFSRRMFPLSFLLFNVPYLLRLTMEHQLTEAEIGDFKIYARICLLRLIVAATSRSSVGSLKWPPIGRGVEQALMQLAGRLGGVSTSMSNGDDCEAVQASPREQCGQASCTVLDRSLSRQGGSTDTAGRAEGGRTNGWRSSGGGSGAPLSLSQAAGDRKSSWPMPTPARQRAPVCGSSTAIAARRSWRRWSQLALRQWNAPWRWCPWLLGNAARTLTLAALVAVKQSVGMIPRTHMLLTL
uniref:Uncharacterized protein n=1 Tax=Macrostomum lignano TaxID=282301 RepID=A0A1I8FI52_9PLAT